MTLKGRLFQVRDTGIERSCNRRAALPRAGEARSGSPRSVVVQMLRYTVVTQANCKADGPLFLCSIRSDYAKKDGPRRSPTGQVQMQQLTDRCNNYRWCKLSEQLRRCELSTTEACGATMMCSSVVEVFEMWDWRSFV